HPINKFKPMMTRVESSQIDKILEETKGSSEQANAQTIANANSDVEAIKPEIEIDDFNKVDLRVATITDAKKVDGADKLVQLTLDIGIETRTVFAGIKAAYTPESLIGKRTVMVANLKPRKMRFGISSGMVLAAGPGGSDLFILTPDDGAEPGMRVK
ncbi:MAG: methionine--tRNA ligase subunit beta, partial [Granulosicoccus sp.]